MKKITNLKLASSYYCIFDYSTLTNYVVGVHLLGGIQRNEGIIQVYSGVDTVDRLQNGDSLEPHEMSSKAPPRLPATSYS